MLPELPDTFQQAPVIDAEDAGDPFAFNSPHKNLDNQEISEFSNMPQIQNMPSHQDEQP